MFVGSASASMPKNKVQAITWDGTNDGPLVRAQLTSVTNKAVGTLSYWFKRANTTDGYYMVWEHATASSGGDAGGVQMIAGNKIEIYFLREGGGIAIQMNTTNAIADTNWHHIIACWDTSSSARCKMYVDDVDQTTIISGPTATNCRYQFAYNRLSFFQTSQPRRLNGDMAEFYFNTDTCIDLTVEANRRKFITGTTKKPVWLGTQGQIPSGSQPAVYFSGSASTWNNGTNAGYGGSFTMTGSVADSSNEPVDA